MKNKALLYPAEEKFAKVLCKFKCKIRSLRFYTNCMGYLRDLSKQEICKYGTELSAYNEPLDIIRSVDNFVQLVGAFVYILKASFVPILRGYDCDHHTLNDKLCQLRKLAYQIGR